MAKLEKGAVLAEGTFRHSSFVILSLFVIRISSFRIALLAGRATTGQ
jgi:hypothetical protein